jgi:hypothetical protein
MVTKTDIRRQVEYLKKQGFDVDVGWAYGRPRIENGKGSRDISPRLPTGQLMIWIEGFKACMEEIERKKTA